jgi:hypothetical protein
MSNNADEPPWKISSKGACWCWYEEITDQELLSILKPEDGCKIEHNGYEYSVKVNENGTIPVFRKQTTKVSHLENTRSSRKITPEKDLCRYDKNHRRIVDIRLLPLDEIHDVLKNEDWEISEYNPVYKTTNGEIVIVLIKRHVSNSKTTEGSD